MATKNLLIRGGADFSSMNKALNNAQKRLNSFSSQVKTSMDKVNVALASIGSAIVFGSAIKDAAKFEALMTTLSESLGKSTSDFKKWQNSVGRTLGFSQLQSAELANMLSLNFKQFASSQEDLLNKTTKMMEVAALISNKRGMAMTEVSDRIRSAMNQEADGADELGVNVRVSAIQQSEAYKMMADGRPWDQLSTNMQKAILYHHILESVSRNLGTTIQDTTQMRISVFTAALGDLKLALGQAFLPIVHIALPALTTLVNSIANVLSFVGQFMNGLFGINKSMTSQSNGIAVQTGAINDQSAAVSGLGEAIKATDKASKKVKSGVAGFDEVNQVSTPDTALGGASGGGIGTGGLSMPALETNGFIDGVEEVSSKAREMGAKVRSVFESLKKFFKTYETEITAIMAGIAGALTYALIATKWSSITGAIAAAFDVLRNAIVGAWAAITGPIGLIAIAIAGLVAAFVYFYQTNETFRGFVDGIFTTIKDVLVDLWNNVLIPLGEWLGTVFVESWKVVEKALDWLWNNILVPVAGFLGGAFLKAWEIIQGALEGLQKDSLEPLSKYFEQFWKDVIVPISDVLSDVLSVAFDFVSKAATGLWENVLVPLGKFIAEAFEPTIEAISAVLSFLWKNVFVPLGEFLGAGFYLVWKSITTVIQNLWYNVLKPLIPFLQGALTIAFETIGSTIDGLKTTFIGLMDFITGVFTGDWEKAWNGVKDIFKGIFDSLYGFVKVPLNLIIEAINTVISGLNSLQMDIPDWVPLFGGQTWGINIPKLPKLARGGIVDGATNFGNYIAGEAGAEMIVPLENTPFVDKLASALGTAVMSAMQFSSGSSNNGGDTILQLDGRTLARLMKPYLNNEDSRVGNSVIIKTT